MVAALIQSTFLGASVAAAATAAPVAKKTDSRVTCMAERKLWAPGLVKAPAHLDGSLPGDFGYDPLGLAKDPVSLARYREAEVMNGRWAMLGVAGMLAPELVGQGTWLSAQDWAVTGGKPTYLGNELPYGFGTVLAVEFFCLSWVEISRGLEKDPMKRIYPGGAFDPLGFGKDELNKVKELRNGRLAMVAFVGMWCQGIHVGGGPVSNLMDHLADPLHNNAARLPL